MWSNGQNTNSDGESILLLQPTTNNRSNKHKSKQSSPSLSYIGGVPRYHESDTLISSCTGSNTSTNPQCSKCNKSMYLLLQLHAPVDDYDRSLYVFGCNNNACHSYKEESDGDTTIKRFHPCIGIDSPLRCFRSQTSWTATASTDTSSKVVSSSKTKNVDLVDNDWGLDDDNASTGWGDDDGDDDWGGGNSDKDVSMNDLEDMLTKCEMQSISKKIEHKQQPQTAKTSQPSSKGSNNHTDKPVVNNAPSFDQYDLDMFNEPHTGNTNDSDEEDDDGNVDSSQVDQMLSRYLDMEDDEEILSVLKGGDTNNSNSNNDNSNSGGGGERYERLPPDERALLAFTNRLKCAPKQVARYAYGGTPLWSIPLPPKLQQQQKSNNKQKKTNKPQKAPFPDIPNCSCGAKRLFEFQILPSLLHVLNVDSHATQGSKDMNMDVDDLISTGGMDWGCIAVYSCSESCQQSREELIIVQKAIGDEPIKKAKPADNDEYMDE